MHVRVLLQIINDDDVPAEAEEIITLTKPTGGVEDLGLSLAESKRLLAVAQQRIVESQVGQWLEDHRQLQPNGRHLRIKGSHTIVFRTLFGDIQLKSPRFYLPKEQGNDKGRATISPLTKLISSHVAPERLYIESRWASLVSYAAAADLLSDVLPVESGVNPKTVRMHTMQVAKRVEADLVETRTSFMEAGCPREWAKLPIPDGRIVMGLDGGYVRDWRDRKRNFELIVGRSLPEDGDSRYVGFVHGYDRKPRRRIVDHLKSMGMQANQDITFITDGGQEVRSLAEQISPCSEHILDWFHITMRITVMRQFGLGLTHENEVDGQAVLKLLERIKWLLWHGNVDEAVEEIDNLWADLDSQETKYANMRKFIAFAGEFRTYIAGNKFALINYGERYRSGERISSSFVEATVNSVVSKRFAKKQQMQWTPYGAHMLLQTRVRALDGSLRTVFERWHPGMANDNKNADEIKKAA